MSKALVEVMARAAKQHLVDRAKEKENDDWISDDWPTDPLMVRYEGYIQFSELLGPALSALEEAGFVVVPREPTEAMKLAAVPDNEWWSAAGKLMTPVAEGEIGADEVYRNMIKASQS